MVAVHAAGAAPPRACPPPERGAGREVIDLYQIHQRTSPSSLRAQMGALADVVEEGHVRAVGVSNLSAAAMTKCAAFLEARGLPLASNQVRYNLLDRRIETNGVLDAAERLGVTIIAYSPLSQGVLTGRYHPGPFSKPESVTGARSRMPHFRPHRLRAATPLIELLWEVAEEQGCAPAQVALAWATQRRPGLVVAIPGASNATQSQQAARSMDIRLTAENLERLDAVSSP